MSGRESTGAPDAGLSLPPRGGRPAAPAIDEDRWAGWRGDDPHDQPVRDDDQPATFTGWHRFKSVFEES